MNRLRQTAVGPTPAQGATFQPTSTTSWTYDYNGNRTQQVITGSGAATTNYGYNAADQLCWTAATTGTGCTTPAGGTAYTYDGNGNQTSGSNSYSNYDQLTSATTVGNQNYAGTTNTERATAGSTTFTNSILGKVSEAVLPYSTQEYVRDPGGTLIAMQTYPSGSTTPTEYYYTADIVGSTIAITDTAGANAATYSYDSWGNTTATTGGTFATTTNPWRYAAGYTDPNGTIKLGARYYNPTTGRFTQPDPSGQEANNYLYAAANPITNSDPTGLDGDCNSYNADPACGNYYENPTDPNLLGTTPTPDYGCGICPILGDIAQTLYTAGSAITGCVAGMATVDSSGLGAVASIVPGLGETTNGAACVVGADAGLNGARNAFN
jgi:RHS repeat-associated protein